MLKNLRSILKFKSFVMTTAACCFLNIAMATELARSQDLDRHISIDVEKMPLKQTLDLIASRAHVSIIYSNTKGIINNQVSIHAKDEPVKKVLNDLLSPLSLSYQVIDDRIVVKFDDSNPRPPSQNQTEKQRFPIKGKVTDVNGSPLPGATVKIKAGTFLTTTDSNGEFKIAVISDTTILQVSFVGYLTKEILVSKADYLTIILESGSAQLNEVSVISTGYQTLSKERATGSFVQINNALINRSVSTNILDRLDGITSGLIFNKNRPTDLPNNSTITIRGRSTLFANAAPLVVIDNFPYDGDLNNINPNDIESFTVLKDAAAASLWGARSGNGVIVITTKKGKLNTGIVVSATLNTTIGEKPDLYYSPQLTSSQYIDAEQFLFNKGAYNTIINNGYSAITPAIEIFLAKRNGTLSSADSSVQINKLKSYDYREQLSKYYYRKSINQQYQGSISGGSQNQKYFISAGYDKNLSNSVGNDYDRITVNASNTNYFLNNKLELFSNIIYTASNTNSASLFVSPTPYTQIADINGIALPVANQLRLIYAQTAGNGKLLDWLYRPLDELNNHYSSPETKLTDYRINASLSYHILSGLKASLLYGYEKSQSNTNTLNELQSYYTRNLINTFSQINSGTGLVTYPIPLGSILDQSTSDVRLNNGRFQVDYTKSIGDHSFNSIAGTEIRSSEAGNIFYRFYGYNTETLTNQNSAINYANTYPTFYGSSTSSIGNGSGQNSSTNHYISYYFNGSYSYKEKYIASGSLRRDEANIFGVSTNQKGVPLWSAGLAWLIDKENFFKIDWLSQLKLRATYGYTGNVSNSLSAYLTTQFIGSLNSYNTPYATIVNPPNPSLRWEKIRNINLGLDFAFRESRISGSLDVWQKNGLDLIGNSPIAPQTGIVLYTGNSANTLTKGADIQINSINLNGILKWYTTLLYNYSTSKVTDYKVSNGTNLNVVSANYNNPLAGYPYYSIFSFKYAGLTNQGDPQGYLNGSLSTDYSGIINSTNRSELVYNGPATPTSFGSLRNTFLYRNFDFSFILSYKLGYYFRRYSLNNGAIYSITSGGGFQANTDYDQRWQKPGDEKFTNVPSLIYPFNSSRDALYTYSDALVERADNIRLQDVRLGYTFNKNNRTPFKNLNLFIYANNLGIMWRANKHHLDPDYPAGIPTVKTIAFGIKADFLNH